MIPASRGDSYGSVGSPRPAALLAFSVGSLSQAVGCRTASLVPTCLVSGAPPGVTTTQVSPDISRCPLGWGIALMPAIIG